jgi:hypothetical protein
VRYFALVLLALISTSTAMGDCYAPSYRSYAPSYRSYAPSYAPSYYSYAPSYAWRYYAAGVYDGVYWDTPGYYAWYNGNWYLQGRGICNGTPALAPVVVVQSAPVGLTLDDVERIVARRIAEASAPKPPPPIPKGATSGLTLDDVERLVAKRLAESK